MVEPPVLVLLPPADRTYSAVSFVGIANDEVLYGAVSVSSGRRALLRVLGPGAATGRQKERFLREASFLRSVRHRSLVRAHPEFEASLDEIATVGYGIDWPGRTLNDYLGDYPSGLPSNEGLRLLSESLSALQALHAERIAVRHMSPDSLLIDEDGSLLLTQLSPARTVASVMTLVEESGTYAAPELLDASIRGGESVEDPDPERYMLADVFSLGLVFYEAFIGRARWRSLPTFGNIHRRSPRDVASRMRDWLQDRRKSLPPLGPARPDLPKAASELVDSMVSKDPVRRPPSAAAALEMLTRVRLSAGPSQTGAEASPQTAPTEPAAAGPRGQPSHEAPQAPSLRPVAAPGGLLPPGTVLARRYRILEEVGRGGMGVVYKATDQIDRRTVAVKILFPHCADAESVKRFQREAQAAARLTSPHIVSSTDLGEEAGLHFLVMDFVDGNDVQKTIKRDGKFSEQEAIRIATEVLEALKVAHDAGIVHRDVKSPNIILDPRRTAKLTDFGIARVREGTMLTSTAATLGTPEYMSPEQCQGTSEVGPASDLYSLGIVLFEMVTGRLPFEAQNPSGVWLKHIQDAPPDPGQLASGLSKRMRAIILTALIKDPAKRFSSARDMIDALQGKRSVPMPGRGSLQRSIVKLTTFQKIVVLAVAIALPLVTIAGLLYAHQRSSAARLAENQRREADEQRAAARKESEEKERQRRQAEAEAQASEERSRQAERNAQIAFEQAQEERRERERAAAATLLAEQRAAEEARQRAEAEARERQAVVDRAEVEARERRASAERAERQIAAAQAEAERRQRALEDERRRRQEAERRAQEESQARVEAAERARIATEEARRAREAREEARRQLEASMPRVTIDNVTVQHNVSMGVSGPGMVLIVEMEAQNLRGVPLEVVAFFEYPSGDALRDFGGGFACGGEVCAFVETTAIYDGSVWSGAGALRIAMPYTQLHMSRGVSSLQVVIHVRTRGGAVTHARSNAVPFEYQSF